MEEYTFMFVFEIFSVDRRTTSTRFIAHSWSIDWLIYVDSLYCIYSIETPSVS